MPLESLDKLVRNAVAARNSRDFMHEHLFDLAGRGEIFDSPQTVTIIVIRLARDRFLADFENLVTLAGRVLLQRVIDDKRATA